MIKNIGKGKSSTGASKAVDLSLLTITKYKKDQGFKPETKITRKTSEQKNQIYMKGVVTKFRNKQIKEEFDNFNKNNDFTDKEKEQKLNEIRKKYNVSITDVENSNTFTTIKNKNLINGLNNKD